MKVYCISRKAMKLWQLILLLASSFHHWTPATADGTYRPIMKGSTLVNVEITGDPISVNLSNLNITSITHNALDGLTNVQGLDLSRNEIETLPLGLFSKLNKLRELSLACRHISLNSNGFHGLNNLMSLDLSGRLNFNLATGYFASLPKFVNIIVSPGSIINLSSAVFSNTPEPTVWDGSSEAEVSEPIPYVPYLFCITHNGFIESFEKGYVSRKCSHPEIAYPSVGNGIANLGNRNITGFRKNWYGLTNPNIHTIILSSNEINEITPEFINNLPSKISTILLDNNKIETIENNGIPNDNLRELLLENNGLTIIEDGAFGMFKLTLLSLEDNLLESMNFVRTLPATLEELIVSRNLITSIPSDTFRHLTKLKKLDLSYNQLENPGWKPGTFKGLDNLERINLAGNEIHELKPGLFPDLEQFSSIDFSDNRIEKIHPDTFKGLNLLELNLFKNELQIIEKGTFSNVSIQKLILKSNRIFSIENGAFNGAHIAELDMSENNIMEFKKELLNGISGVQRFALSENPLKTIEKGSMLNLKDARFVNLAMTKIEALENGTLFGLSTDHVIVRFYGTPITVIEGGVFDDV